MNFKMALLETIAKMFCYKSSNDKSLVSSPASPKKKKKKEKWSRLPSITPAAHNESPSQGTHALPSKYPIYPQRIQAVQPHTSCLLSHCRRLSIHSLISPNVLFFFFLFSLPSISSRKQVSLMHFQNSLWNPESKIQGTSSKDHQILAFPFILPFFS